MLNLIFALTAGAIAGSLLMWLILRSQNSALQQRASELQNQFIAASAELGTLRAESQKNASTAAQLEGELTQLRPALATAQNEAIGLREQHARAETSVASLQAELVAEQKSTAEKLALMTDAKAQLTESFKGLAADALSRNNHSFLELANSRLENFQQQAKGDLETRQKAVETLVAPLRESLGKVDEHIRELENKRSLAYGELKEQVVSLVGTQEQLRSETSRLVMALKAPSVRGRWGEIQLRRVVEMAGMLNYCDFVEQQSTNTEGGRLRPDLIVRLPGGKQVVVDAKTPLGAYLEAVETAGNDEAARKSHMISHARQVRDHMKKLSAKSYWDQFEATPEFVVMFLPGEMFFSAALEQDPGLIEEGVEQKVIPASPTTLIALLRAVNYGWKQEQIARNAQEISNLGKELYDRLRTMGKHLATIGGNLDRAVDSYNKAVGSLETRVMVSARKFQELGTVSEDLPTLEPIETASRRLQLPEEES